MGVFLSWAKRWFYDRNNIYYTYWRVQQMIKAFRLFFSHLYIHSSMPWVHMSLYESLFTQQPCMHTEFGCSLNAADFNLMFNYICQKVKPSLQTVHHSLQSHTFPIQSQRSIHFLKLASCSPTSSHSFTGPCSYFRIAPLSQTTALSL